MPGVGIGPSWSPGQPAFTSGWANPAPETDPANLAAFSDMLDALDQAMAEGPGGATGGGSVDVGDTSSAGDPGSDDDAGGY